MTKQDIINEYEDKIYRAENWQADDLLEEMILKLIENGDIIERSVS